MDAFLFKIAYLVTDAASRSHIEASILSVADHLHSNMSLVDVSVGANLDEGLVEFDVGAEGFTVHDAFHVAVRAVSEAIEASGGVIESFSFPASPRGWPDEEPLPGIGSSELDHWYERGAERVDA